MTRHEDLRPHFDLQAHSVHSDGALSPTDVVVSAREAGVQLLALSDHDTVAGVEEALAAGRTHGVPVIPAVEITALYESHEDLHILGYGIDPGSTDLQAALTAFRDDREARAHRMREALEEVGFAVDAGALTARAAAGRPIGRPHLAQAVFDHPANADRLGAEGLTTAVDVLKAYLLPGTPAYRTRTIPTVSDAIALIHSSGGLAIWAHPFWDITDPDEVLGTVDRFSQFGVDGVEAFYVTHDAEQVRLLAAACERHGLLSTGSSDFHGPEHPLFSTFLAHQLHGLQPDLGAIPELSGQAEQARQAERAGQAEQSASQPAGDTR